MELHPWHQQRLLKDCHATKGTATMARPLLRVPAWRSPALCAEKKTGWLADCWLADCRRGTARWRARRSSATL